MKRSEITTKKTARQVCLAKNIDLTATALLSTNRLPNINNSKLRWLFNALESVYGTQDHWWASSSPFEIMVGAVLTQNTAWRNVQQSIKRLKIAEAMTPLSFLSLPKTQCLYLIQPSGFGKQKKQCLEQLCHWYLMHGGYEKIKQLPTHLLHQSLLKIRGIGPETADDICLYAFSRCTFVIDAYTRRILSRLGWITGHERYEDLQAAMQLNVSKTTAAHYQHWHALLVNLAQEHCQNKPSCQTCPLKRNCLSATIERKRLQ